jgi:hypothetical protein
MSVSVKFRVAKTPNLDQAIFDRLSYHFRILKLAQHFRREANLELFDRKDALLQAYGANGDAGAVRDYLASEAQSVRRSRGLNNWKTALLLALSRDAAFCASGLLRL